MCVNEERTGTACASMAVLEEGQEEHWEWCSSERLLWNALRTWQRLGSPLQPECVKIADTCSVEAPQPGVERIWACSLAVVDMIAREKHHVTAASPSTLTSGCLQNKVVGLRCRQAQHLHLLFSLWLGSRVLCGFCLLLRTQQLRVAELPKSLGGDLSSLCLRAWPTDS